MKRKTALLLALSTLIPSFASADKISAFKVEISTAPDQTLTVRTITTWNGDADERKELVFSPEVFVEKECDVKWQCQEGKGSSRAWHLASPKPTGMGYVLAKVVHEYESTRWSSVVVVDQEGAQKPLGGLKPSCQDFYSDGARLIAVEALQQGYIDPTGPLPEAKATAFDAASGALVGNVEISGQKGWKLLLRNQCGLRYFK